MSMDYTGGKPVVICGPSRTKQSYRVFANINQIVKRYTKDGVFDNVAKTKGFFADVSSVEA